MVPELLERKRAAGRLLVVSAGCAEGEEPYSLAILFRHYFAAEEEGVRVRIVGVDMDAEALETARAGVYAADRLAELPGSLRTRWFRKQGRGFQLAAELRGAVEFLQQELMEGLPMRGVDLLMCRNVLIYFQREQQRKLLRTFRESLGPGGCLVLGKTENLLGGLRTGFTTVDLAEHVYRKAGE